MVAGEPACARPTLVRTRVCVRTCLTCITAHVPLSGRDHRVKTQQTPASPTLASTATAPTYHWHSSVCVSRGSEVNSVRWRLMCVKTAIAETAPRASKVSRAMHASVLRMWQANTASEFFPFFMCIYIYLWHQTAAYTYNTLASSELYSFTNRSLTVRKFLTSHGTLRPIRKCVYIKH